MVRHFRRVTKLCLPSSPEPEYAETKTAEHAALDTEGRSKRSMAPTVMV